MNAFAFVMTGAQLSRSFLGGRKSVSSQIGRTTTRRFRSVLTVTHACANTRKPRDAELNEFISIANTFLISAIGVYTAMSGLPALAVPEALVEAFKSTPASLAHPTLMWLLLGTCVYTFSLGYKSRQIRSVEPERRKELVKSRVTERHFKTSSSLFAIMTVATFSGMANTYARTGKLFPGPHLYAGLGLVASMAIMQSFVPHMQKGKGWARQAHFSMAFLTVGLFGWQAKSGMDIVAKLLDWN